MEKYYAIGEAAKISGMTSETLRHYDRIGLVKPGRVEESTGYRYYSTGELVRLSTIQALRRMDMPLQEIKKVLEYGDLEKVVAFLEQAEKKADEKIAELQYNKSKIQLARAGYERKLHGRQESRDICTKKLPRRMILLSDSLESPTLDNLWDYQRHFYSQIPSALKEFFAFEDLAGIYTERGHSRLFAVCTRHRKVEGLKILPAGTYLCADCTGEDREQVLTRLMDCAKEQTGAQPEFTVQLIIVSGILQWGYQIQIFLGK